MPSNAHENTYTAPLPFIPTIIEHAAFLIGQTPSAAARDASILARAHIAVFEQYRPDGVTVGMDIYNIEAEALGCQVCFYDDESIPGIMTHPITLDSPPGGIAFSPNLGRIQLLLCAAEKVKAVIGNDAKVSVGICGPFSILIELLGFETAIHAFIDEDKRVRLLLAAVLEFQKAYSREIVSRGLGVTVFESWASPPLITPDIYRQYALPYEQALLAHIGARPLVIGGDTRPILDDIVKSGTALLLSDYNTPLPLYIEKARAAGLVLRANIDPKLVRQGDFEKIKERIKEIYAQKKNYPKIIIGTGVVPYDTPLENLQRVKKIIALLH
ncbi:MAG: hypothetical protein FWC73_02635 [Defluviitaleaceae bacterium]|nr:hypothetical protein [Defluviitaleaceae bacterium]